jgi:hypothetical protein
MRSIPDRSQLPGERHMKIGSGRTLCGGMVPLKISDVFRIDFDRVNSQPRREMHER